MLLTLDENGVLKPFFDKNESLEGLPKPPPTPPYVVASHRHEFNNHDANT
jgi:hypothetical protein